MGPPETTRAEGIRVVLGDDADDARTLLRSLLQRDGRFQVVGEAADWPAVIELTGEAKPDAVVVDLALTASAGAGAIDRLRAEAPATRVVVLAPGAAAGRPQPHLRVRRPTSTSGPPSASWSRC